MINQKRVEAATRAAVKKFWSRRNDQSDRQGLSSGVKDAGNRSAVTGGKQLDGFVEIILEVIREAKIDDASIHFGSRQSTCLPGFFRAEKNWDLLVVGNGCLLACIEFKSQVGPSFGNNFNNRTEEAIGNAHDFWVAYREGGFCTSPRPWLGFVMLLEDAPGSNRPVGVQEPHFSVFPEFQNASYTMRYEQLLLRLIRERLYDGAAFLTSKAEKAAKTGVYAEPNPEIGMLPFARSLYGHLVGHADLLT